MNECVISHLNSGADGWSLRPLLYGKRTLSTRPLLLPKCSAWGVIWSSASMSQLLWMTSHARLQTAQRWRWTQWVESTDGMRRDGKNIAWSWPLTQLTALTAQHILQPMKWSHWGKDDNDVQPLEDDKDGPVQEEPPATSFIMIM